MIWVSVFILLAVLGRLYKAYLRWSFKTGRYNYRARFGSHDGTFIYDNTSKKFLVPKKCPRSLMDR